MKYSLNRLIVLKILLDITRELLDRLSGYVQQRVIDYKKARYVNQTVRQALFIDSKAEKENRSARFTCADNGDPVPRLMKKGFCEISRYGDKNYLTTTCLIHFSYDRSSPFDEVTMIAIPNGKLQARYNPTVDDGIWLAGRNAPTRGEDFRVRVGFSRLKDKASWRVQRLTYDEDGQECIGSWQS